MWRSCCSCPFPSSVLCMMFWYLLQFGKFDVTFIYELPKATCATSVWTQPLSSMTKPSLAPHHPFCHTGGATSLHAIRSNTFKPSIRNPSLLVPHHTPKTLPPKHLIQTFLIIVHIPRVTTTTMSDPYNQYPPQQHPYGYAPQQPGGFDQYGQQQQQQYPPQQYPGYPPQQPSYNDDPAGYGPPQRTNSFGPPQAGGFQHGQQGGQFGAYDASNPQGHVGY